MKLGLIRILHNGCELPVLGPQAQVSGRGALPHVLRRAL